MKIKDIALNERIIFALDVNSYDEAKMWVDKLFDHVKFYKVGLQLFIAEGFRVIDMLAKRGLKVMCDLKLHDIPETVRLAIKQLNNKGITYATVHADGAAILEAAAKQKDDELKILAITVLTSISNEDLQEMGFPLTVEDLVFKRAKKAIDSGCDGIVCSGHEVKKLREMLGDDFYAITPGIRPEQKVDIKNDDQARIMTAYKAISNGADHVVVGRPISKAADPISVVKSLQDEITRGLEN